MHRLLLIADSTYAAKDNKGNVYFQGSFSPKTWERYLNISDEIFFVCREEKKIYSEAEATEKLQKWPSNHIHVFFVKNQKKNIIDFVNPTIRRYNKNLINKLIKKCDGVIIRTLGSISSSYVIKLIKYYHKTYMYECVGNAWDALWYYGIKGKILAPSAYFSEKRLSKNADAVLYVTEKYLQKWYPTNSNQIGISDVDIPIPSVNVLDLRLKKIEELSKKIILGTVGSVEVAYKGQEYVIRAIAKMIKRGKFDIEYQLVGSGDNSRLKKIAIDEGIENNIKFLGSLTHEDVFKWLDSIDVYIQPSNLEGMPRSLIEAMSRGVPCLASNVGGIPELLEPKCLFKKKNPKDIMRCLEIMLTKYMIIQSKRNFYFCKKFYPGQKDRMRLEFYKNFSDHI